MFRAALFTMAKTQKQPKSIDKEQIKKTVCVCKGILLSQKKEWMDANYRNMDGPRGSRTKSERLWLIPFDITYM